MLALLGSLLGFGTSFLPKIMDYFQDRQDKKQELLLLQATAEIQLKIGDQKLRAAMSEADAKSVVAAHGEQLETVKAGARWLANLSGSIRPVVTYLFTAEYLIVTWSIAYLLIDRDGVTIEALRGILDTEFMGLFSAMISFYYGNRTFGKRLT